MRMRERERDHKIDSVGAIIAMKENEDVIVQRERDARTHIVRTQKATQEKTET